MDFGEMLDGWMDRHGVEDKDGRVGGGEGGAGDAARRPRAELIVEAAQVRAMAPQDSIDLHGLTAKEAEAALRRFLSGSAARGLSKVLVIHGKGSHSAEGPGVLPGVVRRVLEASSVAGSFGYADRKSGGTGATWVALRKAHFSR